MPRRPIPLERMLAAVPMVNTAVRVDDQGDERGVVLHLPLRRRWWTGTIVSWLLPLRREHGFGLDALGREVWMACDGQQNIERIIEHFALRHRLRFHEARLSVMQFLRVLVERNLLVLVGVEDDEQDETQSPGHGGGSATVQTSLEGDDP